MNIDKLTSEIYSLLDYLIYELSNKTVIFATELDIQDSTDDFYECPIENYVGKHEYNYTYYIFKIESGVAYGVETENFSFTEFKLSELSTDCLLMIGMRFANN